MITETAQFKATADTSVAALVDGERLTQVEFHGRYQRTVGLKAELVEGVVHVAPPVGPDHGDAHTCLNGVVFVYQAATPGTQGSDNATLVLGPESEPQPDIHLRLLPEFGGRVRIRDGLLAGAPELVIEVSDSTVSLDLGTKRRDFQRAGALEYIVFLVRQRSLRAFGADGIEYPTTEDGIYRCRVFPGLWLDSAAIADGNARKALATLKKGLQSPEHTAFVRKMKAIARTSSGRKPASPRRKRSN